MADFDFDEVEQLLSGEKLQNDTAAGDVKEGKPDDLKAERDTPRRARNTSRSRSHDRIKRRRSHSRSNDRRRDRSREHRGNRRERSRSRERRRNKSNSVDREERRKQREEERRLAEIERERKEAEERLKRETEEAKRDDMTLLVLNLSLKATERDVWKFLTEHAGKVRDIQLIRDARSGKSKGVAYVEFYTQEAVLRALNLAGQAAIMGQPIRIQASQAEKNRAARAAKQQAAEILSGSGPLKIYVGGLVDTLGAITEVELKQLFSPFGEIMKVDLHKDPYTGRSKGYAFIQFRHASDARDAMVAMNGFEIAGRQLKVGHATESQPGQSSYEQAQMNLLMQQNSSLRTKEGLPLLEPQPLGDQLEEGDTGLLQGAAKLALMQKLATRDNRLADQAKAATPPQAAKEQPMTRSAVLSNMFTLKELEDEGPDLFDEIEEDVRTECGKYGEVDEVHIDRRVVDGRVFVRFADIQGATEARKALEGRLFAGQPIGIRPLSDADWQMTVGRFH